MPKSAELKGVRVCSIDVSRPVNTVSPYGPDRSLLHAVILLVGGLALCTAGVYVLSFLPADSVPSERRLANLRHPFRAPSGSRVRPTRNRRTAAPVVGGRVPAGVGGERPSTSHTRSTPRAPYEIAPDLGHADLGGSSPAKGAPPTGGMVGAESGRASGGEVGAGGAFVAVDLGRGAPAERNRGQPTASVLSRQLRALDSELSRLARKRGTSTSAGSRTREEDGSTRASSGEAVTAARGQRSKRTNSVPGTPDDPSQVPLGGTEWLAAAGAAYALHRLRKEGEDTSHLEDNS